MKDHANGEMAVEPEDQNAEHETYSREEVEAVLAEARREMQGKLTRAQQEAKEYRLVSDSLQNRLARIEERLMQPQRPDPSEDIDPKEWEDVDSGRKLFDVSQKMVRAEIRKAMSGDESVAKAALQKVADLELKQSINDLQQSYSGLTRDDVNRVMEYGIANGIDDLDICAYKVLGPPEARARTRDVDTDNDEPRQPAPSKSVLVGRGKAQAQAAASRPRQIKVRPGPRGYDDIEREAGKWLKGR